MARTFRRQCPHCSNVALWPDTPTYPFCSERCRLIDLGAWVREEYSIPAEPIIEEEDWPDTADTTEEDEGY